MTPTLSRFSFLLLLLFGVMNDDAAQGKFSLTGGWGYYELVNIGAQWNFSKACSFSLYGGSNFGVNNKTSWSTGLSFDQTFQKPLVWKIKAGYSLGMLCWTSNDDLYYFTNLSIPVMALLAYPVSKSVSARIEGGPILNIVAQSDRKQNVEAGYPARFNANVRVSILYKFGEK